MPSRRDTYDPFKDPDIRLRPESPQPADPKAAANGAFIDRPDHLAGLDPYHPAVLEEEGLEPYPRVPHYPPGRPKRIDWSRAAELLAKGTSVDSTASLLHCDAKRIWRNLRRSRKFRARVDLAAERMKMQADLRFRSLNIHAVLQMRHRTDKLDPKTLHWLAERLRLGQAPEKTESLIDWLQAVATPPGAARRARKTKARANQIQTGQIHAVQARSVQISGGDAAGSNGIQLVSNGTQLALNGTQLASSGTELALNGIELAPTGMSCDPSELDKRLFRL